jgi:hypothetical protein
LNIRFEFRSEPIDIIGGVVREHDIDQKQLARSHFRHLLDGQETIALFEVEKCHEPDLEDYLHDPPVPEPDPDCEAFFRSQAGQAGPLPAPKPE